MSLRGAARLLASASAALVVACARGPQPPAIVTTPAPPAPDVGLAPTPLPPGTPLPLVPTPTAPPLLPTPTPASLGRQTADPTAVVVFAVSALGGAFSQIGSDFMLSARGVTGVSYKFDQPAQLTALLQQGADADVIATTDPTQMTALQQANLLDGPDAVLVRDQLVIVLSKSNPQGIQSLKDLANSGARFVIPAPNSQTTASIEATLDKASADPSYGADFRSKADRNVLARDGDDRFVVTRVASGEVSAGVVYASAVDPQARGKIYQIDIPETFNSLLEYPIAVLKHGSNVAGGRAFMQYALSARAQDVFSQWGYLKSGSGGGQ